MDINNSYSISGLSRGVLVAKPENIDVDNTTTIYEPKRGI